MAPTTQSLLCAALLLTIGDRTPPPEAGYGSLEFLVWQSEDHVTHRLRTADAAEIMLLDGFTVGIHEDWRTRFERQFMAHGVRSPVVQMDPDDVAHLAALLLDPSNYIPGDKSCEVYADAGIVFQGPEGEVQAMLELWCARIHFRSSFGCTVIENADPIQAELIRVVTNYFPEDDYLLDLKPKK
jgi:hypothetical protein